MPLNRRRHEDDDVEPQGRAPASLREKETLIRAALRSPELYRKAIDKIDPEKHFPAQDERWLGDVWAAVKRYHAKMVSTGEDDLVVEPPTIEELLVYYEKVVEDSSEATRDEEESETAQHFIERSFSYPLRSIEKEKPLSLETFKALLDEGLQQELRDAVETEGEYLANLPTLLQKFAERAEGSKSISLGKLDVPFPEDEKIVPLDKVTTNLGFLDDYMGGQCAGEVYCFCAPFGVCKTTLAVQLGCMRADYEQFELRQRLAKNDPNTSLPIVYLVFYEETMQSVRIRTQSFAAGIDRTVIEEGKPELFSTINKKASWKPYEKRMLAGQMRIYREAVREYRVAMDEWEKMPMKKRFGKEKPKSPIKPGAEAERFKLAQLRMNFNLRFLDFTGGKKELLDAAGEMAKGIRAVIDQDQREHGNPGVSMVVVDYAGAAADRAMEKYNYDESRLRHLVAKFPLRLKTNIAAYYKCPVWVMHQLNADANSKAAGVAPKSTDTAEAKNFFEHADFAFVVGTKNDDGMAVIANVKQRRQARRKDSVIYINGMLCCVEQEKEYVIESSKIVPKVNAAATTDIVDPEEETKKENKEQSADKKKRDRAQYKPFYQFSDE